MPVSYPPPLDQLLTLGEPDVDDWLDYPALGIGPEHVPALIRMATDDALYDAGQDAPEGWAYVHAWRALAQLRAAEAAAPLMSLFTTRGSDSCVVEELPDALGRMGPKVLPVVAAYLDDEGQDTQARAVTTDALVALVKHYPETREAAVHALASQLAHFAEQDQELNGFLVSKLLGLRAVECEPVIRSAFAAGAVARYVCGSWSEVSRELGLEPATPPPPPARPLRMKGVEPEEPEGEAPAPKQKPVASLSRPAQQAPAPPRPAQQAAPTAPPAQQTANQRAKMLRKQAGDRRKRKK